jgi:hypothetical protein
MNLPKGNLKTIVLNISDYKQICIASDEQKHVLAHIYIPEYEITDEQLVIAKLFENSKKMYELLQSLELQSNNEWDSIKTDIENCKKLLN